MIGGANIMSGVDATVYCDTTSDVANLAQYAVDHDFRQGSKAYVIATGDLYILNGSGEWIKQ